ncbi:hypothetical protein B0H10DRAFT_2032248 [Mycena sp. CBHHK59/15]|nr:hypothetical protein B0H10DRAFT_2063185 [Mycena sp. CBHHK59/15]KAJ6617614.1 hypothetical protein B0H10DRAFT_2032248 [Mycena sp. CBHHK59/15]
MWDDWRLEIYVWTLKYRGYLAEALAYRHLRSLQGNSIPWLYGTARFPISSRSTPLHPIVDFVPGLAVGHIPGPNMNDLNVGKDITKAVAEDISKRLLDIVAAIRGSY